MSQAPNPDQHVAIVTGAGSGVGRSVARLLLGQGWKVAHVGRTEATLRETAEDNDNALVLPADLADPEQATALVHKTVDAFGRVDALVNNAGMASLVPIKDATIESLRASFDVNAFGPALLIAAAFPVMCEQRSGRIVNVASKGISDPFPGFFAYAAAKAALDSFTRSVHNEGKRQGVAAFTVAPGAIETPMLRGIWNEKQLPRGSALDPEQVAELVVACACGERDAQSGETIFILPD